MDKYLQQRCGYFHYLNNISHNFLACGAHLTGKRGSAATPAWLNSTIRLYVRGVIGSKCFIIFYLQKNTSAYTFMQESIKGRIEIGACPRLLFACNSSMQLAPPQPRRHKVLMSFRYWNARDVIFFDTDRMRTALPRRARFNSDEALIEFAQRAGGIKMSEDRQIPEMMIQRKTGEITLNLTDEQCTKLRR